MKRRPGRPRIAMSKRATNLVSVRLTDSQHRELQKQAVAAGMKMSSYIRYLVFGEKVA